MAKYREKIIIVDSDEKFARGVCSFLETEGYSVLWVQSGRNARDMIYSHCPDLVILEPSLPDFDGNSLIQTVRRWSNIPIIILSSRGDEHSKVVSLDLGADDYIVKPVGPAELSARIRTAFRHTLTACGEKTLAVEHCYAVRGLKVDYNKHKVFLFGRDVKLTPNEFRIMALLGKNYGKVMNYKQIIHELWGPTASTDNKILRVHMANIRNKIEPNTEKSSYIMTEVGVGYMLADE